jgi:hypothetical protein
MKKKIKFQIKKHLNDPTWTPPETRMKHYERDYNIVDYVPKNNPKWKKVKWVDFCILVPDEETKKQLQAACEYLHDNPLIDADFLAVNSLVHAYENFLNTNGHQFDPIVVDPMGFKMARQKTCIHSKTYLDNGIKYCKLCQKEIEVTSYRD